MENPPILTCEGGNHPVASYSGKQGLPQYVNGTEYGSGTIYYPADLPVCSKLLGSVVISPGGFNAESSLAAWGPYLASFGIVVMNTGTVEPRNIGSRVEGGGVHRGRALLAAARVLRAENTREASPLRGHLDVHKIAVMGHSNGGSGALHAAISDPLNVKACVSIAPGGPNDKWPTLASEQLRVPTLLLAGEEDKICPPCEYASVIYEQMPSLTPKLYFEVSGGDHLFGYGPAGTTTMEDFLPSSGLRKCCFMTKFLAVISTRSLGCCDPVRCLPQSSWTFGHASGKHDTTGGDAPETGAVGGAVLHFLRAFLLDNQESLQLIKTAKPVVANKYIMERI